MRDQAPRSLALFCRVVDNFGDIGICYRLARQLVVDHGIDVTLWVDDLHSFQRICPEVVPDLTVQTVEQIRVVHWRNQNGDFAEDDVADIVIEFFGCELPPAYIAAMKLKNPVWINLEGLSAEDWVESCHTLPSPQYTLTKYFYYPGFTGKTGGLLLESDLLRQRDLFQHDPSACADFLVRLGVTAEEQQALRVSLFCYPHAPVAALFAAWQSNPTPVLCLVPQGVAEQQVQAFLGSASSFTRGSLTVRRIPFLAQSDYDRLLWSCDVNFVRGEDSFVRAQWAARPFIWHIYPQDKNLHHVKLQAFLQRTPVKTTGLVNLTLSWNEVGQRHPDFGVMWRDLERDRRKLANLAPEWQDKLLTNGDLATNLLHFAAALRLKSSGK